MTRALALAIVITVVAACKQDPPPPRVPAGPRCYVLAPGQPSNPAGDVLVMRERYSATGMVFDSVVDQYGHHRHMHEDFHQVGDHLEANDPDLALTLSVEGPADAPTRTRLRAKGGVYDFEEITEYDANGMNETSVDPQADGTKKRTTTRYALASCDEYERALRTLNP